MECVNKQCRDRTCPGHRACAGQWHSPIFEHQPEADLQEAPQSLHHLPQLCRWALVSGRQAGVCVAQEGVQHSPWHRAAQQTCKCITCSSFPAASGLPRVKRESSPGPEVCRWELRLWLLPLSLAASHHRGLPAATPPSEAWSCTSGSYRDPGEE